MKILLADDSLLTRKIVISMLRSLDCEVAAVSNGLLAIEAIKNEPFDLVLMDLQMPEMDGIEAARHLRQHQYRNAQPPLIALTAGTGNDIRKLCFEAGFSGFLPKPISKTALLHLVNKYAQVVA